MGNPYAKFDDYGLRHLSSHLIAIEWWDELEAMLCDLRFVEAKCAAGLVDELEGDYNTTFSALPEAQLELEQARTHQQEVADYTQGLIAYARAWSKAYARHTADPAHYPLSPPKAIRPPTLAMVRPWTDEEIQADTERIIHTPTRLDRLRAFATFVRSENHHLRRFVNSQLGFCMQPGFCVQQAYNSADAGLVERAAESLLEADTSTSMLLLQSTQRAVYTPHSALLRTIEGHTNDVTSVSVTPDGRTAVSGSTDDTVRVWDLASGACRHILRGHADAGHRSVQDKLKLLGQGRVHTETEYLCTSVSVTPDGQTAVSGCTDKTVRVWDLTSGECRHTLHHTEAVWSVSVAPDGLTAVSGCWDGTVWVWDLASGQCRNTFQGHASPHWGGAVVGSVSVTPDGRTAVSGSGDDTVRVWDLVSGQCRHILRGCIRSVTSVSVTPDGRTAVSGSGDQTVRVWDLASGQCRHTLPGHTGPVTSVSVTPDGQTAISGGDRTVRVWDLASGKCRRILQGHTAPVESVSVTPDGQTAVSGSRDKTVRVWDLISGVNRDTLEYHTSGVSCMSMTPDGRTAVSGSWDKTLRVWDLTNGELHHTLRGHTDGVWSVSVTPDGRTAVSGSDDSTVRVWNLTSGTCRHILQGHKDKITSVSITLDGRTAISGGYDTVRMWDLASGKCRRTLRGRTAAVESISVTPDDRTAVSGSTDGTVRVWDLSSGVRRILQGHTAPVRSVSITPDGRTAVSGSDDSTVRVWDLTSGECRHTLQHATSVRSVSVTPDGRTAVSSSDDGFVWVWDLASGTDSETLVPPTDDWYIGNVSVTLDGLTAVSGCDDSTVRVWNLTSGRLLAILPIPGGVSSLSTIATNGQLGIGTESGQVIFVKLQNVPSAPPLITAIRPWLFSTRGSEGSWERLLTAECPHCNYFFGPHGHPLTAIQQITLTAHLALNQSPCLELSPQVWDEPRLLSQCPRCHQPLRFNPFVLDQRDQVPIVTEQERGGTRSWLISTFVWSPLIIAVLSYCLGTLPTFLHFDRSLAWAALVGLILAWSIMGRMRIREEQTTREEVLALAGVGTLVTAGALTMSLVDTSQIGLLGLAEVAAGVMIGVAGGLASGVEYPGVTMELGLAVSVAAVGALVAGTLVAGSLGGGLLGLVVRVGVGLVTFVVGGLAVMLIAWLILKIVQRIVKLSWPVGSVSGVVIGLVAAGILIWLGQGQVGKIIFLAAAAYSVAVGIAGIMQLSPGADRSPRLGWGMRIAVVASFLVLIWICLLGSWPLQAH